MRILMIAAATLALGALSPAQAFTLPGDGGLGWASQAVNIIDDAQVMAFAGRRYCFYVDAWNGAGWYRCGFAWRRGYGFGGVYGWNNWYLPRYHARFHRGDSHRHGRQEHGRDRRDGGRNFRQDGREARPNEGRSQRQGE